MQLDLLDTVDSAAKAMSWRRINDYEVLTSAGIVPFCGFVFALKTVLAPLTLSALVDFGSNSIPF